MLIRNYCRKCGRTLALDQIQLVKGIPTCKIHFQQLFFHRPKGGRPTTKQPSLTSYIVRQNTQNGGKEK